jgi:Flp pilus assembly CpaF family ATPase
VAIHSIQSGAISRGARMLRTAFGPAIARFLDDPDIIEVMLNPDGRLWIDRLSSGLADTGQFLSASDGERIVRLVAHHVGAEVHAGNPRVSAELPETGGALRGANAAGGCAAPAFAIRKPAVAVFALDDYVAAGIMSSDQAHALRGAVGARKNILVAGGASSGKPNEFEANIIWRAADLLGASSRQRVALRQLVLADNATLARVRVGRPQSPADLQL